MREELPLALTNFPWHMEPSILGGIGKESVKIVRNENKKLILSLFIN
jgi:hypothetical protein